MLLRWSGFWSVSVVYLNARDGWVGWRGAAAAAGGVDGVRRLLRSMGQLRHTTSCTIKKVQKY